MSSEPPVTGDTPPQTSMDEVMASIRRIVSEVPPPPLPEPDEPALPVPPAPLADGMTLDAFLRSMLEPMLKTWLDANLPEIVEAATRAEIARLTGRSD